MVKRGTSGINCLIAIDKPEGPSSHDVVAMARRLLGERRIGHAGTLDPAASGVLVLGIGQATRLLGLLALDDKRYDATIRFGYETNTDDAEGERTREADVPAMLADERQVAAYLASLVGEHQQVPPAFSAISKDGKRAYARARAGEQVILEPRPVSIYESRLLGVDGSGPTLSWRCSFYVSKGTYVRSIARDIGRDLGTAAHLEELRRTASGLVDTRQCLSLSDLEADGPAICQRRCIDPLVALRMPTRTLDASEARAVANGQRIECGMVCDWETGTQRPLESGERVAFLFERKLVGIWERQGTRIACVANLPGGVKGPSS